MKYFLLDNQKFNTYIIVLCSLYKKREKDTNNGYWPIKPYIILDFEYPDLETINKYRCEAYFSLKHAIIHKKNFIELCNGKVSICIKKK